MVRPRRSTKRLSRLVQVQFLSLALATFCLAWVQLSEDGVFGGGDRSLFEIDMTTPSHPFDFWCRHHSNTAGARFVALLKKYLHSRYTSEGDRILACRQKKYAACFAGQGHDEAHAKMPLANMSVYDMRRYAENKEIIANLGTDVACLPLLLAGAAVPTSGVVVELGPYVGLTTRCLGLGLNATKQKEKLHVFDTFKGAKNYKAITSSMPWTKWENPFFTDKSDSFLWLWEKAIMDVYPTVKAHAGWITSHTITLESLGRQDIAVLVVDSVKSWKIWQEQLGGLGKTFLKEGSIFAAMDFMYTDQPNFVYGCLRDFMQPVYTSWCLGEHWMFVVTKTIPSNEASNCMKRLLKKTSIPERSVLARIEKQVQDDLRHLRNLGGEFNSHEYLEQQSECTQEQLLRGKLGSNAQSEKFWKRFAEVRYR